MIKSKLTIFHPIAISARKFWNFWKIENNSKTVYFPQNEIPTVQFLFKNFDRGNEKKFLRIFIKEFWAVQNFTFILNIVTYICQ